jgi:hypothetical protein
MQQRTPEELMTHEIVLDAAHDSGTPGFRVHPLRLSSGAERVVVRLPCTVCASVHPDDGHIFVAVDDNVRDLVSHLDRSVVSQLAHHYDKTPDEIQLRYLSSVSGRVRPRMKLRIPVTEGIVRVPVFDGRGARAPASLLWAGAGVRMCCVVELEAAWAMEDALWVGTYYKALQITVLDDLRRAEGE